MQDLKIDVKAKPEMKLTEIDPNLKVPDSINIPDLRWMDSFAPEFRLYGAAKDCRHAPFCRLPPELASGVNEGVAFLAFNTAGLRLRFRTDSPYVAIHAEWDVQCCFPHMPVTGVSGFDLYAVRDSSQVYAGTFTPPFTCQNGYESVVPTPGGIQDLVLNFPLYNNVSKLFIGVSDNASFEAPGDYSISVPAVFYGSSITQGGCASRPGNSYQSMLSRALDMDYVNLGFSGSARGETAIAEYIAGLSMSVFVCDYDHNAPSPEHLQATHFPFYERIRQAQPDVPYVMLTKPDGRSINPDVLAENIRRRDIIRDSYEKAVSYGDRNVYFIDGFSILEDDSIRSGTVDGCHPGDYGFYCFYKVLLPVLTDILKQG